MKSQKGEKLEKGQKIGKYQIVRILGEGSFGKVFLGSLEGQLWALKCIPKKSPRSTHNQIRNLKSETQLLSKLGHQNIIAMKEFFETADEVVVVMEFAGDDLAKLLEKQRRLPQDRVRSIGRQILAAMLYLHENRILHRDLKPQNILMQGEQIKLCDFGFAKKMSASTNFLSSVKGTPLYLAPEIVQNRHYTHKVDVWSFGIILYELAYGRTPFHSTSIQQLQPKILHQPVRFPRDMSTPLRELIDGMLQKSDLKRFDWGQVKNHPFFAVELLLPKPIVLPEKEEKEQRQPTKPIQWVPEQEFEYLKKVEIALQSEKMTLIDLKFNEEFCIRVVQLIGQACIDRSKVPRQTLLKLLQRIVSISRTREQKENPEKDLTRNKQLMTAIITLAMDEQDNQLLTTQLELVGFLLQQNYDKVKIDTDHDDQITTLIAAKLAARSCPKVTNYCLKVLGILTSQALLTFSNSQQYFQRLSEEHLLTRVAECYSPSPQNLIVLELLEKFIHPRLERNTTLSHRMKAIFRGFKEEVAPILLKNGLISDFSPLDRAWKNPKDDLQLYCIIVYQLLQVSEEVRKQYLKRKYWKGLLGQSWSKLYFLAMSQTVLKNSSVNELSVQMIQNEIVVSPGDNKLVSALLIYFTPQHFSQSIASLAKRNDKNKQVIAKIECLLRTDPILKTRSCKQFIGFFAEDSRFFDDLIIETLYNLVKDSKEEEVQQATKAVLDLAILQPLSQESMFLCLDLAAKHGKQWGTQQIKRIDGYLTEMAKKDVFDDYLTANPSACAKLLTALLHVECSRIDEEGFLESFCEMLEKTHLLRLLFSEQLVGQDLLLCSLKIVNRLIARLTSLDFLSRGALQVVKKFFKTLSDDLRLEIITFCSHLARISAQFCGQLLDCGIVSVCSRALGDEKEALAEKTLHLLGNLAKHNDRGYQQFEKYQIACGILRCVGQFRGNRKILKNMIYAVGNIAFHREQFTESIRQLIRFLPQGLEGDDAHLALNTISTVSNLLRHSARYVSALIESGIFSRILQLYAAASSADLASYVNNVLRKAVRFPEFLRVHSKEELRKLLEGNLKRGMLREGDGNVRNLKLALA